jgi:hypothetical protein
MLERLRELWAADWQPLSRGAAYAWAAAFALFLLYAAANHGGFLFIDNVNLVVHEAGHLLFGWFGSIMLTAWAGTILQLLVPLLLAGWFFFQRQPPGYALCLFVFFENWLNIATYMADARAMALPLVTVGDPGEDVDPASMHDWHAIFGNLGVLDYDTRIAATVRLLGWAGMIAMTVWVVYRAHANTQIAAEKS